MSKRPHETTAVWRSVWVLAALVAMVGLGGWLLLRQPGPTHAEPGRLVAQESTIDLGHVPFDRLVEGRFVLENTGGSPVRIVTRPTVKTLEGC